MLVRRVSGMKSDVEFMIQSFSIVPILCCRLLPGMCRLFRISTTSKDLHADCVVPEDAVINNPQVKTRERQKLPNADRSSLIWSGGALFAASSLLLVCHGNGIGRSCHSLTDVQLSDLDFAYTWTQPSIQQPQQQSSFLSYYIHYFHSTCLAACAAHVLTRSLIHNTIP